MLCHQLLPYKDIVSVDAPVEFVEQILDIITRVEKITKVQILEGLASKRISFAISERLQQRTALIAGSMPVQALPHILVRPYVLVGVVSWKTVTATDEVWPGKNCGRKPKAQRGGLDKNGVRLRPRGQNRHAGKCHHLRKRSALLREGPLMLTELLRM